MSKNSGEFYMPPWFLEFVAKLARTKPEDRILDLCWRNDDLLDTIARQQPSNLELWGVSCQEEAADSRHKVTVSRFFSEVPGLARESFDMVLVNPPWISRSRLLESICERSEVPYGRLDSVALCLEWSMWYLRTGGRIIAIVPGGFLSNYSSKPVREFLRDRLQLQAVFVFTPKASVFKGSAVSTAIIYLEKTTPDGYQPESLMAEVADVGDLGLISGLYEVASRAADDLVPFQIMSSKIGQSYAFTCEPRDTFSPARNYFAQRVANKLVHFPTERLGDIATIRAGAPLRDQSSALSQSETPYRLLTGRDIVSDGHIVGSSFVRKNAAADALPDTFRLRPDDILVRAIQQSPGRRGHPVQPGPYEQGLVVSVVPPEHEGSFFDQSLLCIRLRDDAPPKTPPHYVAQLLRNEYVLQGFNDLVLDQILAVTSSASAFARATPSLVEDLRIPVLPDPMIADYQERLKWYFGPYWQSLSDEARLFLATAELWYDFTRGLDLPVLDFGGAAIEFCRSVEVELWRRIGQHLGDHLACQGIEKYPHWNVSKKKYTDCRKIGELRDRKAMLGRLQGFLWGVVKHSDNTAHQKYRDQASRIYAVIAGLSPQPQACLLDKNGIPKLLDELIKHRNASAHKDRIRRPELEELHNIVMPDRPDDSIMVQIVHAIPLPGE
jgi:hypothetical protein